MNKSRPKVIVAGAMGKMGAYAMETFLEHSEEFELVAGIVRDVDNVPKDIIKKYEKNNVKLLDNLKDAIHSLQPDILVELTTPESVYENARFALKNGVRPVVGATGLSDDEISELAKLSKNNDLGAIIAPNFAIGAILMMEFSKQAAKYFDKFEIIERHHDKKIDAPSGTAIKTAKAISEIKKPKLIEAQEKSESPAYGALHYGVPIHSLRLPGYVASQEVVFGGLGQTLKIEHNTIDRSSFMPGIVLSSKKVMGLNSLVYGLENLL